MFYCPRNLILFFGINIDALNLSLDEQFTRQPIERKSLAHVQYSTRDRASRSEARMLNRPANSIWACQPNYSRRSLPQSCPKSDYLSSNYQLGSHAGRQKIHSHTKPYNLNTLALYPKLYLLDNAVQTNMPAVYTLDALSPWFTLTSPSSVWAYLIPILNSTKLSGGMGRPCSSEWFQTVFANLQIPILMRIAFRTLPPFQEVSRSSIFYLHAKQIISSPTLDSFL